MNEGHSVFVSLHDYFLFLLLEACCVCFYVYCIIILIMQIIIIINIRRCNILISSGGSLWQNKSLAVKIVMMVCKACKGVVHGSRFMVHRF